MDAKHVELANKITTITNIYGSEPGAQLLADALAKQKLEHDVEIALLRARLRTIGLAGEFGPTNGEVVKRLAELENTNEQARQYIQNAQAREHRINELETALATAILEEHDKSCYTCKMTSKRCGRGLFLEREARGQ